MTFAWHVGESVHAARTAQIARAARERALLERFARRGGATVPRADRDVVAGLLERGVVERVPCYSRWRAARYRITGRAA